jgi:hypothetical protein
MRVSEVAAGLNRFARLPGSLAAAKTEIHRLLHQVEIGNLLAGKLLADKVRALGPGREIRDAEFRVYSQWGDDGIIQYLTRQVAVPNDTFIEFGVQNYEESNTRFLLVNDNWRGLVMDGGADEVAYIQSDEVHWRHDLTAVAAFITRENINQLIKDAGFGGPLGILSIDIDGNDYWVWEAIDVVDPAIVIVEYNSVFGPDRAVSVPYDPKFVRSQAHASYLYWGCSVAALCHLADRKGYVFVGCNSNGNNAYFVKRSLAKNLLAKTPKEGYVLSRFRESRDESGALSFKAGDERFAVIADMPVVEVTTNAQKRLGDV